MLPLMIDFVARGFASSVIEREITSGPVLHLPTSSIVNNRILLLLLKKSCYTARDVRAGWIGSGLPHTDSAKHVPLARWATEHWAMYSGFLSCVERHNEHHEILDIGCGLGYAANCLGFVLNEATITGIDIDEVAIRFAERFNNRKNVCYVHGDFFDFSSSKEYTHIFALEILEHLPAAGHYAFIDKCLSMLEEGGLLFVTTPNALDERDSSYAHIGLLNRSRAHAFFERYQSRIFDGSFYDNQELLSGDPSKFIVQDPVGLFEDTGRNRSHFRLVMR